MTYVLGMINTRYLELDKFSALCSENSYDGLMSFSKKSKQELGWWISNIIDGFKFIDSKNFDYEIETDASLQGGGAHTNSKIGCGLWSCNEMKFHINVLELMAVFNGLNYFLKIFKDCKILLRVDNVTAIAYINRQGGCHSKNCLAQARNIYRWCEERNIIIQASYINTKDNFMADAASRDLFRKNEFYLDDLTFSKIKEKYFEPDIDLFASYLSAKSKRF